MSGENKKFFDASLEERKRKLIKVKKDQMLNALFDESEQKVAKVETDHQTEHLSIDATRSNLESGSFVIYCRKNIKKTRSGQMVLKNSKTPKDVSNPGMS